MRRHTLDVMIVLSIFLYFVLSITYQFGSCFNIHYQALYILGEKIPMVIFAMYCYDRSYNSNCILASALFGIYNIISVLVYILSLIHYATTIQIGVWLSQWYISIPLTIIGAFSLFLIRQTSITKKRLLKQKQK